jgi:hypothetical protein
MSKKNQTTNAAAEIVASLIPSLRSITRSEAKKLCLGRAVERFNEAQAARDENVRTFDDEDGDVCVHPRIEPLAENPNRGICVHCDEEFPLRSSGKTTQVA